MIQEKRLVDAFLRFAALDNPTYHERLVCDAIKSQLDEMGIRYDEDGTAEKIGGSSGNLYAYVDGEIDLPPLLFSAHMDSVDPAAGKTARIHPDGTITSDGTTVLGADDLSGVCVILEAVRSVRESGAPHRPVELLFDVAEETYCEGIQHFDFTRLRSREAYILDLAGRAGTTAYKAPSIISFAATYQGCAAHAAFSPESGIHAVKAAAEAICQIECGRVGDVTVNVGTVHGGSADNVVAENCTVTGEVRGFCDRLARQQLSVIESQMKASAEKYGAELRFVTSTLCRAYEVPLDSPAARRFRAACKLRGLPCELTETYGGSDNNHYFHHGISGLVMASGMNSCHSCQEYSSVSELVAAAELTEALILSRE